MTLPSILNYISLKINASFLAAVKNVDSLMQTKSFN